MSPLCINLRERREKKGWTQQQLADRAGIRQGTISKLEAGQTKGVDFATLEKLADALGVEPGQLVERAPSSKRRT